MCAFYKTREPRIDICFVARKFCVARFFILNRKPRFGVNQSLVITDFYVRTAAFRSMKEQSVYSVKRVNVVDYLNTLLYDILIDVLIGSYI